MTEGSDAQVKLNISETDAPIVQPLLCLLLDY